MTPNHPKTLALRKAPDLQLPASGSAGFQPALTGILPVETRRVTLPEKSPSQANDANAAQQDAAPGRLEARAPRGRGFAGAGKRSRLGVLAGLLLPLAAQAGDLTTAQPQKQGPPLVSAPAKPLCFLEGRLCFDVEERVRFEARDNNFDFNNTINTATDDAWLLQRFRLGVALQATSWLKFYAQGQDAREIDSERLDVPGVLAAEGDDAFDLRQAYVKIGDPARFPLTLQVGRQLLAYGDERLVGTLDWNNFSRSFDAARLHWEQPRYWVDVFTSSPVLIARDQFNKSDLFNGNETRRDLIFSGIYASTTVLKGHQLDVYGLVENERNGNDATLEGNTGFPRAGASPGQGGNAAARTDFLTYGFRLRGDPKQLGGWEYDTELVGQIGRVQGLRLEAYAAHVGLGYNFQHLWAQPRLYVEYNFATGDDDRNDDRDHTFQNLFPTNHKFYGYMDLFSWENLHNPAISLSANPLPKVNVRVDGHAFFAATNEDAWYRANGLIPVRPIARDAGRYEGAEIDVVVKYKAAAWLALEAGYSHFIAGDFLRATGRSDDADFGYAMATLSF